MMKYIFTLTFILILLVSCTEEYNTDSLPRQIPLRDFFKNPEKARFMISPSGKFYSYLAPFNNRMNLFVQEIGKDKPVRITNEIVRDIQGYFWASDNRIIYSKDKDGDENFKLYAVNADGSNLKTLVDFDNVTCDIIDGLDDIDDEILISMNKRNPEVFDAYRLNIITGELKLLAENPGNIAGWLTDHNGKLRVAVAVEGGVNNTLLYRDNENEQFRPIITTNFRETLNPQFFTFDNKSLYCSSNLGRDKQVIVEFDINTGKEKQVLYENQDYDVTGLSYSKKRKVLTAAYFVSWKGERYFFDKEMKSIFDRIEKELGNIEISITSMNKSEDKFIIRTYSDKTLGDCYLYDKNSDKLTHLAAISPWIKPEDMADVKPIKYKSRDGLTIHGYLTLPKGMKPENLPVVVNPHGGPWSRNSWGYNPETQFLANRGFAVFQMNFRGSTGYGRKFWEASFKEWGKKMQDDITDGVNWLIEQGIADPNRIAIYGSSYGGYAALAGLAFTPNLYAAGVDYVGVTNMFTYMKSVPPYWKPFLDMLREMIGDPKKDSLLLADASPAFHADKIGVPLLIAQGANDPKVKKAESDLLVDALKKRGMKVDYIVKDNEGHGFKNEENRIEFYESMEKFLKKHLLRK